MLLIDTRRDERINRLTQRPSRSGQPQDPATVVLQVHHHVAGLLGQPRAGGVGGHAVVAHPAGGVLDAEEHSVESRAAKIVTVCFLTTGDSGYQRRQCRADLGKRKIGLDEEGLRRDGPPDRAIKD
jgi:hypothetical protein